MAVPSAVTVWSVNLLATLNNKYLDFLYWGHFIHIQAETQYILTYEDVIKRAMEIPGMNLGTCPSFLLQEF